MLDAVLAPYDAVEALVGAGGPLVLCIFLAGVLM